MLGERLAELRKAKGLTQEQFAKILSISSSTIQKYEQGINEPDDATKIKIAKYFNVTCDYLLGLVDKEIPLDRSYNLTVPRELTKHDVENVKSYMRFLLFQKSKQEPI